MWRPSQDCVILSSYHSSPTAQRFTMPLLINIPTIESKMFKIHVSDLFTDSGGMIMCPISSGIWDGWTCSAGESCRLCVCFTKLLLLKPLPTCLKRSNRGDMNSITTKLRGFISPPPHRFSLYKRAFTYVIFSKYNSLPRELKATSLGTFKRRIWEILANRAWM